MNMRAKTAAAESALSGGSQRTLLLRGRSRVHIRGVSSTPPTSGSDKLQRLTADLAGRYRVERELGVPVGTALRIADEVAAALDYD